MIIKNDVDCVKIESEFLVRQCLNEVSVFDMEVFENCFLVNCNVVIFEGEIL